MYSFQCCSLCFIEIHMVDDSENVADTGTWISATQKSFNIKRPLPLAGENTWTLQFKILCWHLVAFLLSV